MRSISGKGPTMSDQIIRPGLALRCAVFMILMAVLVLSAACGSEGSKSMPKTSGQNISAEDVERDLKFDARVSDFDTDGDKLMVNVNEHWMSSPAGMQQTAVKRWLARWQASRSDDSGKAPKDTQVIVRYEGDDILTATPEGGVKVVAKAISEGGPGEMK